MAGYDSSSIMSDDTLVDKTPRSAIGRALQPPSKSGYAMNSMAVADSFGAALPNLLPVAFNDDSLIAVPVMRPEDIGKVEPAEAKKKSIFSSRRRSTNQNFIMKQVPRHEYLMHYAKDDNGRYVGTGEPAKDCILRGDDVDKYRKGLRSYGNEVGSHSNVQGKKGSSDGIVR